MSDHTLVIGGTGMLADACVALASECEVFTMVARTTKSLAALDQRIASAPCQRYRLALDWNERDAFVRSITGHVETVGCPNRVVAWLHEDALGPALAKAMFDGCAARASEPCEFFQVRGSMAADPTRHDAELLGDRALPECVRYHEIILGFLFDGTRSQWLTDSEIATGVIAAIRIPTRRTVLGTVTPWSRRP